MAIQDKNILITGGAGFIGSHLTRLFVNKYPDYTIVNLDKLTYAGNLENLKDIEDKPNYTFVRGDIEDMELVKSLFTQHHFTGVLHCAAESHVDRSITDPLAFVKTNVLGTVSLLQVAKEAWKDNYDGKLFYHISTDEVYGSLGEHGFFTEETAYDPRSPYSASKASSDHFVKAFYHTYHLPVIISNCSNNYGPYHFPEKLIPLIILNAMHGRPLPVYGDGSNIRDWLFVEDHARALHTVLKRGQPGEKYNIGGRNERQNIDVVRQICRILDRLQPTGAGREQLITFVKDRPRHEQRYAIDASKLEGELGWRAQETFESGIEKTVRWYLLNEWWWRPLRDKVYAGERLGLTANAE